MIVDDEEFCLATMKVIFNSCRFDCESEIDFCIEGEESLNKVKEAYENGMTYGIIFMDFSMPVLNGIDATKEIRNYLTNVQNI